MHFYVNECFYLTKFFARYFQALLYFFGAKESSSLEKSRRNAPESNTLPALVFTGKKQAFL